MSLTSLEGAIADLEKNKWGAGSGATDLVAASKHAHGAEAAAAESRIAELTAELTLAHSELHEAAATREAETSRLRTLLAKEKAARQSRELRADELERELTSVQRQHRESLDAAMAAAAARPLAADAEERRTTAEVLLLGSELEEREQELSASDAVYAQLASELKAEAEREVTAQAPQPERKRRRAAHYPRPNTRPNTRPSHDPATTEP